MNGMPHLAYLGICRNSRGLPQSTQMAQFIVLNVFAKFFVISTNTHITLSHTVYDREIWGTVEPLYNGHHWETTFVPYSEVSLTQGLPAYFQ